MKKQQWLLGAGLLVFIGLMIGATLLYNSLAMDNTINARRTARRQPFVFKSKKLSHAFPS